VNAFVAQSVDKGHTDLTPCTNTAVEKEGGGKCLLFVQRMTGGYNDYCSIHLTSPSREDKRDDIITAPFSTLVLYDF